MKRLIVIESAEELLDFACRARVNGDPIPVLPDNAKLIVSISSNSVKLEADGFTLSPAVDPQDVFSALARRCEIDLELKELR